MPRPLRPAIAVAVTLVLALAACGGDDGDDEGTTTTVLGAAEPARAPEPGEDPAGTVVELGSDPEGMAYASEAGILAVALRDPTELALLRGTDGVEVGRVPLPGHARHLQVAGPNGPVLVPAEDSNEFVSVALPGGEATRTGVGEYPHDAAAAASGRVLVADEKGGTLSVVEDDEVVHTFDDRQQPGGVAAVGDDVAVVDVGDFTLSLYDVDDPERLDTVSGGDGPTHIVATNDDRLVVADTRGDELLVFSADPLAVATSVRVEGSPYGLAYDSQRDIVWVTATARNLVIGYDLSGVDPVWVAEHPTVQQPNTVAVDPVTGTLWVASRATGELQTITDP